MTDRRFYSFTGHIELEILDPIAVRAAEMGVTHDGDEIGLLSGEPIQTVAARLFTMLVDPAVYARAGLKLTEASIVPRFTSEDGSTYIAMTMPEMPVRRDDGSFAGSN